MSLLSQILCIWQYLPGVFYPSLASLCSKRVVEGEKGFLMSTMLSGTHLGYVTTHTHQSTSIFQQSCWPFSFCSLLLIQDAIRRRDRLSVIGPVWVGEHLLHHWLSVWHVGPHCLAGFPERCSDQTRQSCTGRFTLISSHNCSGKHSCCFLETFLVFLMMF